SCSDGTPICAQGVDGLYRCSSGCRPEETLCGSNCVDSSSDVDHCNGCTTVCPQRANATRTCQGGVCGFACTTGFGDCDGDPQNGGEADWRGARWHWGGCTPAGAGVHATPSCVDSPCHYACNDEFADCDATPGCETDITTADHCGGCATACPDTASI